MLRTQRHCRQDFYRMIGDQLKMKSTNDRGEYQQDLHHRERVSDANPRTAAKRKVRIFWQGAFERFGPSIGAKFIRRVEESRIAMRDPLKSEDLRARRKRKAAEIAGLNCLPADSMGRRIQSQCLLRDLLRK